MEDVAAAVSLPPGDILTTAHAPQVASVGLPFVIAELQDAVALGRARPDLAGFEQLSAGGAGTGDVLLYVHVYTRSADDFDIRARMFSPLDGIPEDPATGSANCALAGLLTHLDTAPEGSFAWRIAQGVEMGRPSVLEARTAKQSGEVTDVWIGGESVMVSEGFIQVGDAACEPWGPQHKTAARRLNRPADTGLPRAGPVIGFGPCRTQPTSASARSTAPAACKPLRSPRTGSPSMTATARPLPDST